MFPEEPKHGAGIPFNVTAPRLTHDVLLFDHVNRRYQIVNLVNRHVHRDAGWACDGITCGMDADMATLIDPIFCGDLIRRREQV